MGLLLISLCGNSRQAQRIIQFILTDGLVGVVTTRHNSRAFRVKSTDVETQALVFPLEIKDRSGDLLCVCAGVKTVSTTKTSNSNLLKHWTRQHNTQHTTPATKACHEGSTKYTYQKFRNGSIDCVLLCWWSCLPLCHIHTAITVSVCVLRELKWRRN